MSSNSTKFSLPKLKETKNRKKFLPSDQCESDASTAQKLIYNEPNIKINNTIKLKNFTTILPQMDRSDTSEGDKDVVSIQFQQSEILRCDNKD